MSAILEARRLTVGYGQLPVVRDLDLIVAPGEVVALLGPNGAGKTTTLLALSGALPVQSGSILWDGKETKQPLFRRARQGTSLVTEDRSVIMKLTVRDNLRLARVPLDMALNIFPELESRVGLYAGDLSGGEQQMLALARALGRSPRLLLADELSLGLAPIIVQRLLAAVRTAAVDHGVAALVVEQHVAEALHHADRAYVMSRGRVEMSGTSAEVRGAAADLEAAYLGRSTS